MAKFKIKNVIKNVELNETTRLLTHLGAQNPRNDERPHPEDAARNRAGGGAVANHKWGDLLKKFTDRQEHGSAEECFNVLVARILKDDLTVEQMNKDPNGALELAVIKMMEKNGGPVSYSVLGKSVDHMELRVAQEKLIANQLSYDTGLEDISNPVGISGNTPTSQAIMKAQKKDLLPTDSYRSAGEILEEQSRVQKQEKQRQWFEPDPDAPLPWFLRR